MFRLGWQVLCGRLGEVVDPARARRAAWIAGAIAIVALAGLVVLAVVDRPSGSAGAGVVRSVLTIAFSALAVWAIAYSCFPTAREVGPELRINGRQIRPDGQLSVRASVQPYLERRARPVDPEDREHVLNDVPLLQRGLVRRLSRLGPLLLGVASGGAAGLAAGQVEVFVVLWPFVYLLLLPDMVVRLGRAERARLSALETDPPAPKHRPPWRRTPHGSKLDLPE
ncbi:hypothetical protein DEJ23_06400 [Curtobacterium sp. MCSS17_008]|uniref:hypothetical protein n=1 Tax=Curtobacterium sp. MCSS17_008 TaxID=2175647 RepID=UPI000DAA83D7|nr:hypothetical protein [Curtobacterium sp. MCSS17_008]PZF57767.1 hypothetical protein DEJ23_06400 [Curtobacterium sp. MCSS17_008]